MNSYQLLLTALRSLNKHKIRSLLTTLGIIVGIISIIAVMSIGEGAKYRVKKEIEGLGTNFILVIGGTPKRLMAQRGGSGNLTLKEQDYTAIINECDGVAMASPGLQGSQKVLYEGNNWQTQLGGVNQDYLEIRNWALEKGDFFDKNAVKSGKKVAVIGQTVKNEIFGKENPIGRTVRIKKIPFTIIGVLAERGKSPDGRDEDDIIFVPVKTMQKKLMGIKTDKYGAIIISAKDKDSMNKTADEIKSILRQRHNLLPTEEDDFTVFTQDDISKASDAASGVLNILLLVIASISLIVGGIGIMNIMLVTVTERTKEIGIRMAIGATTSAVLTQFVLEAIIICLFGGLLGIFFGSSIAYTVGQILGWPIFISLKSIAISLFSAISIGLFFGYYPAKKASRLNVVEALLEQ
ncbi:ABC transporter permease [Candidatus Dependentiae bacterium]|nr:ABC transporter permease [Candidatus Dependentiae bacterium]MBU4386987.1 ABC transporter permease [Candidatus Dependentiae bacterium]MCG2756117.1 ABC transporter permease [Candidatus Dependentiae bacterium]